MAIKQSKKRSRHPLPPAPSVEEADVTERLKRIERGLAFLLRREFNRNGEWESGVLDVLAKDYRYSRP